MPLCPRQVLYSEDGYTYLDVRPELEVQEVGKVKGSVNIPIMHATRKYDPEQKKKVVQKTPNDAFADMVKKRFPDPETKLLVACSDGRKYSMDALMALDEAGYTSIAGLKVLPRHQQHRVRVRRRLFWQAMQLQVAHQPRINSHQLFLQVVVHVYKDTCTVEAVAPHA